MHTSFAEGRGRKQLGLCASGSTSPCCSKRLRHPARPASTAGSQRLHCSRKSTSSELLGKALPNSRAAPLRLVATASAGYALPSEPSRDEVAAMLDAETEGNVSFGGALMNVLNILSGVGLLSVPYALRKAGWAGLGVLWLLGIVTNYTGKILVECCTEVAIREKAKNPSQAAPVIGYEDIGEAAYGKLGRRIVSTTMYTELLGICSLLFILEGENMFKLLGTRLAPNAGVYILIAAALMIPTVWLPDLRALSYLGVFGFAATVTVALTVGYTFLSRRFVEGAATTMASWSQVPIVFGILAFVYAGHGVFPSIQASMQKPKEFPKVLNTAYVIVALMCTFLGALGYLMYGSGALDVITFNLPAGVPATLCASIILINPIAKLALTLEPVAAASTSAATKYTKGLSEGARNRLVRTALALSCLGAACFVPFLALVMSLIGSFLTIGTSIVLPVVIHLQIFKGKLSQKQWAWDVFVLVVGIACAISGTASSLLAIVNQAAT